jgi:hypothetical protein
VAASGKGSANRALERVKFEAHRAVWVDSRSLITVFNPTFSYKPTSTSQTWKMSFGTSIGDIILLIQLAHQSYRNCKQAGGQYLEIAREVRNLHSVLRNVRDEAEIPDSALFQADSTTASNLKTTTDGCREALEGVEALLAKYHGLAEDGLEVSGAKKFWHRWKFGNELDEVVKFRWKIMSYTSTMAVLMDSINLGATNRVEKTAGRVEDKVEAGFNKVMDRLEGFEDMRIGALRLSGIYKLGVITLNISR